MRTAVRLLLPISLVLNLMWLAGAIWPLHPLAAQDEVRYFPETGHTLRGRFLDYWNTHGGLAQQGYPLTEEFTETSALDNQPYTVQYFERAVYEYHPENAGSVYEVLLTQLGKYQLDSRYPNGSNPAAQRVPEPPTSSVPTSTPTAVPSSAAEFCGQAQELVGRNTYFCMSSESGDYIGAGRSYLFTEDDALFTTRLGYGGGVDTFVQESDLWNATFAPPNGSQLQKGTYEDAQRAPFREGKHPGIDVSGAGRGCNEISGRFTVLEFSYDYTTGEIQHVAIDFEQHCEGGNPALYGQLRYHATVGPDGQPVATPNPAAVPTATRVAVGPRPATVCAQASQLAGQDTYLCMSSESGDFIGAGRNWVDTPANATITAGYSETPGTALYFGVGGTTDWNVEFAPPHDQKLAVGIYDRAERYPFESPKRPGLSIVGDGRGCNRLTGTFEVLEIAMNAGKLSRFAANFEQHCEGGTPALLGQVRYHSTIRP
jgi:hypothetical protein